MAIGSSSNNCNCQSHHRCSTRFLLWHLTAWASRSSAHAHTHSRKHACTHAQAHSHKHATQHNVRRRAQVAVGCEDKKMRILSMGQAAFTSADVGKEVSIQGDAVTIRGKPRHINWTDAKHHDCLGMIKSVDQRYKGKVQLEDGQEFENVGHELQILHEVRTCACSSLHVCMCARSATHSNMRTLTGRTWERCVLGGLQRDWRFDCNWLQ